MKQFLAGILLAFIAWSGAAQPTPIGGIVNGYADVTGITGTDVTVGSFSGALTGVSCGDVVVVIQMKGATCDASNGPGYGDVTDIGSAGRFEWAVVESAAGSVVTLRDPLQFTYTPSTAPVQMVVAPSLEDAEVTSVVTAPAWDGQVGGIVALDVRDSLVLSADIDATALGFQGNDDNPTSVAGVNESCVLGFVTGGCIGTDYAYPTNSSFGVAKGEGIALAPAGQENGRGHLGNAGGGGGIESGGGGGGGHGGAGGDAGGCNLNSCQCSCSGADYENVAGIGGQDLGAFLGPTPAGLPGRGWRNGQQRERHGLLHHAQHHGRCRGRSGPHPCFDPRGQRSVDRCEWRERLHRRWHVQHVRNSGRRSRWRHLHRDRHHPLDHLAGQWWQGE